MDLQYFSNFALAARDSRAGLTFLTICSNSGDERISYRTFWTSVVHYRDKFRELGVEPGDTLLIFTDTQQKAYFAFFGAQLAGGVPAIMPPLTIKQDPTYYKSSHHMLIERIKPAVICGSTAALSSLAYDGRHAQQMTFDQLDGGARKSPGDHVLDPEVPGPTSLALLQHSSGTTGLKKGVALTYRSILSQISAYSEALHSTPSDRIISWLPLYHDMGMIACTVLPFVTVTPVVVMDPFTWLSNPLMMLTKAMDEECTLAWLPNFAFDHLTNAATAGRRVLFDLSALRMIINCSEVCRPRSIDRFRAGFSMHGLGTDSVQTCYALAENVFAATQSLAGEGPARLAIDREELAKGEILAADPSDDIENAVELVSSGRPIRGCKIGIKVGNQVQFVERKLGELMLQTDCLFDGYFGDSNLTNERLSEGWFQTRDLGFLCEGHIYVLGRTDDVIIYRGRNLFAADLEDALMGLEGLKPGRAVIFGISCEVIGSEQVVVVLESDASIETHQYEDLERRVRARLQGWFAINPVAIVVQPPNSLRKTTSGKISRAANKQAFLSEENYRVGPNNDN